MALALACAAAASSTEKPDPRAPYDPAADSAAQKPTTISSTSSESPSITIPLGPQPVPEAFKPQPIKIEPAKAEPAKPEPAKAEPVKPDVAKLEPAKLDPIKSEPAKPDPTKVEPAKVEQKAEPPKAETALATTAVSEPAAPTPSVAPQPRSKPAKPKAKLVPAAQKPQTESVELAPSEKPPVFRCFVRDVMAFYDRTHVRCYNKARGQIAFFAVDTGQPIASTVLSKALNGMQMGKPITITFAPGSDLNPSNCDTRNCRRLIDIK